MAIAGFDIACKSPAKNGCKAQSTGFVKKMSWLRNSVHFHYNVRVVRTTRRDCKEHSKGKTDHSFLISSHAWHVTSSIFKPHAPWDHGEPTRIRTDRTDMLAAQGHSDGALWFLVTFGYVAHAESLKWYSLSANFEKLMFLPPTSIRVHTIAVCQSSPLIAWLHHFFTSFGMGQGQGQAVSSTHTSKNMILDLRFDWMILGNLNEYIILNMLKYVKISISFKSCNPSKATSAPDHRKPGSLTILTCSGWPPTIGTVFSVKLGSKRAKSAKSICISSEKITFRNISQDEVDVPRNWHDCWMPVQCSELFLHPQHSNKPK